MVGLVQDHTKLTGNFGSGDGSKEFSFSGACRGDALSVAATGNDAASKTGTVVSGGAMCLHKSLP
jgi:hypothetical protein